MIDGVIESVVFGNLQMPGELVRLVIAFAGVSIAAYYDVFNRKNIPDAFLYAFLALSFLVNLFFYQEQLFIFSIGVAAFFSAIGYVFYRVGQIGGADLILIASLMLLLPISPSFVGMIFGMPFIFPIMIFAGVLFSLYVLISFAVKLMKQETHPQYLYLLMAIPYLLFMYVYIFILSAEVAFSPVFILIFTILFISLIFFMIYRNDITMLLAEKMDVSQVEPEDVLALELMDSETVKKYELKRLASGKEIDRMKELGVGEVWVYTKLPPFIPFILAGMFLALFFSESLIFIG